MLKNWTSIIVGIIIGGLSGVGYSQLTIVGDVRENKVQIRNVREQLANSNTLFEARLSNIIKLWEAQLNTERELIALVREQIVLIERSNNNVIRSKQ